MWRSLGVFLLLLLFLLGTAFSLAQVYVPPYAVDRVSVWVYQDFPRALAWFQQEWPRFRQAVAYIVAVATGALIGREVKYRTTEPVDGVLRLGADVADAVADAVVSPRVWGVREAVLRDIYRDLRSENTYLRDMDAYVGITNMDYLHGIHVTGVPYIPPAVGRSRDLAQATQMALAEYESYDASLRTWTEWLFEGAASHGYTGLRSQEYVGPDYSYYTEGPEVLVSYRPTYSYESWADGIVVQVAGTPPVVEVVTTDYEVWAMPQAIYYVFAVPWVYTIRPSADWCQAENYVFGVGFYFVKLAYERFSWSSPIGPLYRVADAGSLGAVVEYRGFFPRPQGDGRLWYYQVRRLYTSAESAMFFSAGDAGQIASVWGRICAGRLAGVEPGVYPWDVDGAGQFGTAVRQRDGALVWWLVRPLEALREAFVPRVGLAERFARISAYAADRFPWSVYYALRVPSLREVGVSVPCFELGNNRRLCPNEPVVQLAATASRAGFGLLLLVGVGMWLGRRVTPSLRL